MTVTVPSCTLVLGGAASGKSAWAEAAVADAPTVTYVATAPDRPGDADWARRVAVHRERRPAHWHTVETRDLVPILERAPEDDALLIEDLGGWLAAILDEVGGWDSPDGMQRAREVVDTVVSAWSRSSARVVAVSPEVGLGVVPSTSAGGVFRDELGRLNRRLAATADRAVLVVAGCALELAAPPSAHTTPKGTR